MNSEFVAQIPGGIAGRKEAPGYLTANFCNPLKGFFF